MSSANVVREIYLSPWRILDDPGASGTISVKDQSPVHVDLVSAAAETRTLSQPTRAGAVIEIGMKTDGGDITLTVTGGYDESGSTTFTFSDPGQFAIFVSFDVSGTITWRKVSDHGVGGVTGLTATATELNTLHNQTLTTEAGAGITGGTGTVYKSSVQKSGGVFYITITIDLTGLQSSTTDLDIIGQGTSAAHIGQITAAQAGTVLSGRMTCWEAPATGVTDIDLYSATEATGKFDDAVTGLTETAMVTAGGAWAAGTAKYFQDLPVANQYLYLTCGAAGTVGTYTAGKFTIELIGY